MRRYACLVLATGVLSAWGAGARAGDQKVVGELIHMPSPAECAKPAPAACAQPAPLACAQPVPVKVIVEMSPPEVVYRHCPEGVACPPAAPQPPQVVVVREDKPGFFKQIIRARNTAAGAYPTVPAPNLMPGSFPAMGMQMPAQPVAAAYFPAMMAPVMPVAAQYVPAMPAAMMPAAPYNLPQWGGYPPAGASPPAGYAPPGCYPSSGNFPSNQMANLAALNLLQHLAGQLPSRTGQGTDVGRAPGQSPSCPTGAALPAGAAPPSGENVGAAPPSDVAGRISALNSRVDGLRGVVEELVKGHKEHEERLDRVDPQGKKKVQ